MSSIEKLLRPLDFAARNDFANLGRVKGLEAALRALVGSLPSGALSDAVRTTFVAELEGLDRLEEHARRRRVLRLKALLEAPDRVPASRKAARRPKASAGPKAERVRRGPLDDISLGSLHGVGPKTAERLSRRGLDSVHDALLYLPRGYEDRRASVAIAELVPGRSALIEGQVLQAQVGRAGRRRLFEAVVSDGTGTLSCRWFRFHPRAMEKRFVRGASVRLFGAVSAWGAMKQMVHPEIEGARPSVTGLVPLYPEIEGLPPRSLRDLLQRVARDHASALPDPLPDVLRARLGLPDLATAVERAHLPRADDLGRGGPDRTIVERLVFDELFFLELALLARRKKGRSESGLVHRCAMPWPELAGRLFPFALTRDQSNACDEIVADLERPCPMNRLLQGDVGSGKTAVALLAAAWVKAAGRQTVILAPTEILAMQHAATARTMLGSCGLSVELLVGAAKDRERRAILERLRLGQVDLLIGTHAVLEPDVAFSDLGLAVIDEQHRFGVEQRAALRAKSKNVTPDVLVMTATPIPRTLALTVYGDLDVSLIRHRPPGRRPVATKVYAEEERLAAYLVVEAALERGDQVYVVFPLVESSEVAADLKAATRAVSGLERRFPRHRVGLLHGRMKPEEKAKVMEEFREGRVHLLVSTTVIEVGVDVPNATVLVLENAERFGLSQVHQLRGRVGRGEKPGECLLIADSPGREAMERLQVLEGTEDGFAIAEADLRFRGPGEILGTKQAGLPMLMIADLVRDKEVLERAREAAAGVLEGKPALDASARVVLERELERRMSAGLRLFEVA